jgi:CheY-like chemotaxis protein
MSEAIGLVLCDDLIFASRITGTARSLGLDAKAARTIDALQKVLQDCTPRCLIVDLANPTLKLPELMTFLREHCTAMPRVVAFGSHVDTASLAAARAAGCDPVLPRSKFVDELPTALASWCTAGDQRLSPS